MKYTLLNKKIEGGQSISPCLTTMPILKLFKNHNTLKSKVNDMNKKSIISILIFLCFFACTDRPIESDAEKYFKTINPTFKIVSVRIDEDEAACRTFEIIYQDNSGKTKKNSLLYFDDSKAPYWKIAEDSDR